MADAPLSPSVVELPGPFEHVLVHTRGLRLHAAVAGDPAAPLIVLLHGSFGGWFDYLDVIAPLAEGGFHVAAVDARGYGLSDKPPAVAGDDLRTAAGDIAGLILALGHDDAVVVGSDTGGSVAWALASAYPERVSALVSVAAAFPSDLRQAMLTRPWSFAWMIARSLVSRAPSSLLTRIPGLMTVTYRRQLLLNTTAAFHSSRSFDDTLHLRRRAARIGRAPAAIVRNNRLLTSAVTPRWASEKVTAPTLLLEPALPAWRHLNALSRARVSGPVEVTGVPGTKNLPQIEDPSGFVTAVLGFLGRHL